ncbi:MAG: ERAP1-like C-terminal domain-containing protein, partial [Actinomycetota bacterium]
DLLSELEAKSGRNLDGWVATWLQTAGVNTLRPVIKIAGKNYESISIKQEAPLIPAGSKELRPHRLAVGLYDLKEGVLSRRKSVELDVAGDLTNVSELAGEKIADLLLINDRDLSYGKIRFDERSINTLKSHLGKLNDNLSRALCWSAAWDMLRDAELSSSDFIDIAIAGLPGEDDITTVTALGNQLISAIEVYASAKNRDALREKVANTLSALLDSAKPGSDFQLQFARVFATLAHTKAHGVKVRELLDGKLNGLVIDADLRWHLLLALVERGLAGASDIDAELTRDNTLTGKLAHERCMAAIPSMEAKEAAFKKATENFEISNWSRLNTIQGFARPLHREMHAKFIDKYFAVILDIYNQRSYEDSSTVIDLLYPSYVVSNETLEKTGKWLNSVGKDAHPTLRRHVLEAKDSLERALRVQAVDR